MPRKKEKTLFYKITSITDYLNKKITIVGYVKRIFYENKNNESPFTVAMIDGRIIGNGDEKYELKFVCRYNIEIDSFVKLVGTVEKNKYGISLQVETLTYEIDEDNLIDYLTKNKMFKGVGKATASKLVGACDGTSDFEDRLMNDTDNLIIDSKVKSNVVYDLKKQWYEMRNLNNVVMKLKPFSITIHQIQEYIKAYGEDGIDELIDNPYLGIIRLKRFGFKKADNARIELGYPEDMPERIHALTNEHVHKMTYKNGNTWIDYEDLMESITIDYGYHIASLVENDIRDNSKLRVINSDTEIRVTPVRLYNREVNIANMIKKFVDTRIGDVRIDDDLMTKLTDSQKKAVFYATEHGISVITGGAGTGKTYTMNTIIKTFEGCGQNVLLLAPTGKAAKRIEELTGRDASTVHRALIYDGTEFQRPESMKFEEQLIIIDEASMLDVTLFEELLRRINHRTTAVVIVGDHNQLPSIGPGNVLKDLIESNVVPTTKLDFVFRQAGTLKLNSTEILNGKINQSEADVWEVLQYRHIKPEQLTPLVIEKYLELFDPNDPTSVKLLTPFRIGEIGTNKLNKILQRTIQQKFHNVYLEEKDLGKITLFDIVIQNVNNYDINVMNGTVGLVTDIIKKENEDGKETEFLRIQFEKHESPIEIERYSGAASDIGLAYALTVHKVQGSEFNTAIVIQHKSHLHMLNRNLMYTAVTRAQHKVILFIDHMIHYALIKEAHERQTFLGEFLRGEMESVYIEWLDNDDEECRPVVIYEE